MPKYLAPESGLRAGGKTYRPGEKLPSRLGKQMQTREADLSQETGTDQPPNYGRFPIQHITTFQGLATSAAHAYRNPDEAFKHSRENALRMRRDCFVMECVEARQRAVALLNWHIEPENPRSQDQKSLCDKLTSILKKTPRFTEMRRNLLEAVWYGRYAVQMKYSRIHVDGQQFWGIAGWKPINGDKLAFRFDDGSGRFDEDQIGIKVTGTHMPGDILQGDHVLEATEFGLAYFLRPWERKLMVVHKHMVEDAAFEDYVSAGAVHGLGVRSRIYWTWIQMQEILAYLMEFIERTSQGIWIYYFPFGSKEGENKAREAAMERGPSNVILMPRMSGDPAMDAFGIDRIDPNPAGAAALKEICHELFGHRIKRYILGQNLTSESDATGLGSGLADLHYATFLQIAKYDATNLEETITCDALKNIKDMNFPGAKNIDVYFKVDTESSETEKKLSAFQAAWNMGARIKESDVMDIIGASTPTDDDQVLQNPQIRQQERLWQQQEMEMGGMGGDPNDPNGDGGIGPDGQPQQGPAGGAAGPGGEDLEDLFGPLAGLSQEQVAFNYSHDLENFVRLDFKAEEENSFKSTMPSGGTSGGGGGIDQPEHHVGDTKNEGQSTLKFNPNSRWESTKPTDPQQVQATKTATPNTPQIGGGVPNKGGIPTDERAKEGQQNRIPMAKPIPTGTPIGTRPASPPPQAQQPPKAPQAAAQPASGAAADGQDQSQSAAPKPSFRDGPPLHERQQYAGQQLHAIHGPAAGVMRALQASPQFKKGGEYSTHSFAPEQVGRLHQEFSAQVGKEFGGGRVVDLGQSHGQGAIGFSSPAGAMVLIPPQAEGAKWQVHYTAMTGPVARAMKGQPALQNPQTGPQTGPNVTEPDSGLNAQNQPNNANPPQTGLEPDSNRTSAQKPTILDRLTNPIAGLANKAAAALSDDSIKGAGRAIAGKLGIHKENPNDLSPGDRAVRASRQRTFDKELDENQKARVLSILGRDHGHSLLAKAGINPTESLKHDVMSDVGAGLSRSLLEKALEKTRQTGGDTRAYHAAVRSLSGKSSDLTNFLDTGEQTSREQPPPLPQADSPETPDSSNQAAPPAEKLPYEDPAPHRERANTLRQELSDAVNKWHELANASQLDRKGHADWKTHVAALKSRASTADALAKRHEKAGEDYHTKVESEIEEEKKKLEKHIEAEKKKSGSTAKDQEKQSKTQAADQEKQSKTESANQRQAELHDIRKQSAQQSVAKNALSIQSMIDKESERKAKRTKDDELGQQKWEAKNQTAAQKQAADVMLRTGKGPSGTPFHQMTRDEFSQHLPVVKHKQFIHDALLRGEQVPVNVLSEYPEVLARSQKSKDQTATSGKRKGEVADKNSTSNVIGVAATEILKVRGGMTVDQINQLSLDEAKAKVAEHNQKMSEANEKRKSAATEKHQANEQAMKIQREQKIAAMPSEKRGIIGSDGGARALTSAGLSVDESALAEFVKAVDEGIVRNAEELQDFLSRANRETVATKGQKGETSSGAIRHVASLWGQNRAEAENTPRKRIERAAQEHGVSVADLNSAIDDIYSDLQSSYKDRESEKKELRKMTNLTQADINRLENDSRGGDYANVKGLDTIVPIAQRELPTLAIRNLQDIWDRIKEGVTPPPARHHDEVIAEAVRYLKQMNAKQDEAFWDHDAEAGGKEGKPLPFQKSIDGGDGGESHHELIDDEFVTPSRRTALKIIYERQANPDLYAI